MNESGDGDAADHEPAHQPVGSWREAGDGTAIADDQDRRKDECRSQDRHRPPADPAVDRATDQQPDGKDDQNEEGHEDDAVPG